MSDSSDPTTAIVSRVPKRLFDAAVIAALLAFVLAVVIVFVAWAFDRPIQVGSFGTVGLGSVSPSGMDGSLPSGAVVAFEAKCPSGWSRFEPAASRVILGASTKDELDNGPSRLRRGSNGDELNARPLGSYGGTEQVTLKPAQMPSHSHTVTSSPPGRDIHDGFTGSGEHYGLSPVYDPAMATTSNWPEVQHPHFMSTEGAGDPHFNMPPYVALQYCRKE